MSGILRSFDRIVSQSALAKGGHKYLLNIANSILHPTAYFYRPVRESGERLANTNDAFQLSITAAALARQAKNYQNLLSSFDSTESIAKTEVQERLTKVVSETTLYSNEAVSVLGINGNDFPVQTVADLAYVFSTGLVQVPNVQAILTNNLVPVLKSKLGYASLHNLQDILVAFVQLNFTQDKALIQQLLQEIAKKDFPGQLVPVNYQGWSAEQYELKEGTCSGLNVISCRADNFSSYISAGGADSFLAKAKFTTQNYIDLLVWKFINPIFFRENRINYRFEARNSEHDIQVFAATLTKLGEVVPEAASTIAAIKAKL